MSVATASTGYRLTQYARGGGRACKIPPGDLEKTLGGLSPWTSPDLVVGLETGDDPAVVRIADGQAIVSTTDHTAVVDDAYVSGGTRRNLSWVQADLDARVSEEELLLLADAQISGGLLVVRRSPGPR